jgi:thiosulfate/3-mercaptopyruvate sulfurtransferase
MTGRKIILVVFTALILSCSDNSLSDKHGKLVSTGWLRDHLNDSSLSLIYVGRKASYDSIHIPNSQFISIRDLLVRTDSLSNELPDINKIDSILISAGIDDHSTIVLYYANDYMIPFTTRLFLTMDYAGLREKTFLLNGGLPEWIKEGRMITDSLYYKHPGKLTLIKNDKIIVSATDVKNCINNPEFIIIDARSSEGYTGYFDSVEDRFYGGHIEGAVSLPSENLFPDTLPFMFKNDTELRKEFEKAGMDNNKTAVFYCGTGIMATVDYFVSVHLGYKSLFYDGSFENWEKLHLPVIRPVSPKPEN